MQKRKKLLSALTLIAAGCTTPSPINTSLTPLQNETRGFQEKKQHPSDWLPHRLKIGTNIPLFLNGEKLNKETKEIERAVSLVAQDYNPETIKELTRKGGFYFPQIEGEYFFSKDPYLSCTMKCGAGHFNIKGEDHIYPFIPLQTNIRVETTATVGLLGLGIDWYPLWEDRIKLHLGAGIETYGYIINSHVKIRSSSLTLWEDRSALRGWGATNYIRAGLEVKPKWEIIPENCSFSFVTEHHFSIYDSDLEEDASGTRFLFYIIKELK